MVNATLTSSAMPFGIPGARIGRPFIGPVFDLLVIGGGLSLVVGPILWGLGFGGYTEPGPLLLVVMLSNHAHFASSTVRLYSRPKRRPPIPLVTVALPVVAFMTGTAAILAPEPAGLYLFASHLIWSPYHYAAQAYGLCVMYAYRSGNDLCPADKRLISWVCLTPFLWTLLQPEGGAAMIAGHLQLLPLPLLAPYAASASALLTALTLLGPLSLLVGFRRAGTPLPLLSLVVVASNAVWWTLFNYLNAFFWATVFHGVQYLAIVTIFHVKDRLRDPENTRGWLFHALTFYGASAMLGYVLFAVWPWLYGRARLNYQKSLLLTSATINIHHFIVDAFIWRLRRDPNYRTVVDAAS